MKGPGNSPRIASRLDAARLLDYALRNLAGRALSAGELRARLARRALNAGDVDAVLEKLAEYGVVDDRRFAETFAAARLQNQGLGSQRVLRDLRGRRVASPLAAEAVRKAYSETDEEALVEAFLARKFRHPPLAEYLSEPKHLASAYRKLRYAGFSAGVCVRVLKKYSTQADSLEDSEEPGEPA